MTAVAPADSTYAYIERKVRRLTASSSESSLKSADIQQAVNNFYNQNMPNAIKTDQMRSVYTFYTAPNIDRYPVNVNYNQGFRSPIYVDGVQGTFFKDREQFFWMWPRWPTLVQPATGDGSTQQFSFTIAPVPFLSKQVTLGCVDTTGNPIRVSDDGNGNLLYDVPNAQVSVPGLTIPPATNNVPGMKNLNTGNPGDLVQTIIGTVNYVTGAFAINFALVGVTPASGQIIRVFVSQYTTGRPYSLLFWNNELTIRPIPKYVHKVEVETYQTPVQFMLSTNSPIMNQWAKYIAYGSAIDILIERQDIQGVQNLQPAFDYEEGLVLERQAVEEIGQRNATIFSSTGQGQGNYYGSWGNF